jgi:hypothetical protein
VIVATTTVFGPCPDIGVEEQVASAGKPVHEKLIALVKLLEAINPMLVAPDPPGVLMVTLVGPETAKNPGRIVNVTGVVLELAEKLGSPA